VDQTDAKGPIVLGDHVVAPTSGKQTEGNSCSCDWMTPCVLHMAANARDGVTACGR